MSSDKLMIEMTCEEFRQREQQTTRLAEELEELRKKLATMHKSGDEDVKATIHRLRAMAADRKDDGVMRVVQAAERYEFFRTLAPLRFAELFQENLRGKLSFDQIIDREMHNA